MSSLKDIVTAMCTENENSTLGWDVVVNYSAKELNNLLRAQHEQGGEGQLEEISVSLPKHDNKGNRYNADFVFEFGAPFIQFTSDGTAPFCSVSIPITGGTVTIMDGDVYTINPGVYILILSAIPLATANGTVGAHRNPQDSDQPFIFTSPSTTGIVTLNLDAADTITVEIKTERYADGQDRPESVFLINDNSTLLAEKIKTHLRDPKLGGKITWDLGHINNNLPSSDADNSLGSKPRFIHESKIVQNQKSSSSNADNSLVPKSFHFAVYISENKRETFLSLFIQTDNAQYGRKKALQATWTRQWKEKYNVLPIPSPYTASVIFNNRMITSLMNKSAKEMTIKKSPDQPAGGGIKLTVLTHKRYYIESVYNRTTYHWKTCSKVNENLDEEDKALHITIGQNGNPDSVPSAQLEWGFTSSIQWEEWCFPGNLTQSGTVRVTNELRKTKLVDDSNLPDYLLHIDVKIDSSDWDSPETNADKHEWWEFISGGSDSTYPVKDALPSSMPSATIEIIDFNFFMTTNLLLPGSNVIKFEKAPGPRFPKDLYLVGHVAEKYGMETEDVDALLSPPQPLPEDFMW